MKIKLTSNIGLKGQHCEAGQVVDIDETEALNLIGRGRAIPVDEGTKTEDRSVKSDDMEKTVTKKKTSKKKATKKAD